MQIFDKPFIAPEHKLPEITVKVVCLSIFLAVILAASNAYLALKIGILTSASIPAAILSMGILRLFRQSNILENNLVQTAASAGEAVAGGVVYTIPALLIIHFWTHFNYFETFAIALLGGILGVLFSVPIRRVLVTEPTLRFPEGRAIAEVLLVGTKKALGLREMLLGGAVGGLLELAQTGLKVIASNVQAWFVSGNTIIGFGGGFSATLLGAGYLIGFNVGISILIGAILGWGIGIPILSSLFPIAIAAEPHTINQLAATIWNEKIRFIGIGAMLFAGVWTLLTLLKPFYASLCASAQALRKNTAIASHLLPRTERDIPLPYVLAGIGVMLVLLYFLLEKMYPFASLGSLGQYPIALLLLSLLYILIIGFIFSAICGYFSGLVGVTPTPGSAIIIAGLLLAALLLRMFMHWSLDPGIQHTQLLSAAAVTIIIGAIITGTACIANDNIQDLKVGHIVGATPWKQQIMLIVGVIVAAAVIPPIMELLFNVYGIGGVFPHPGMDPSKMLAAPPAAMMAAITQGVFNHDLPWSMIIIGMVIAIISIIINSRLKPSGFGFSVLGIAIGIYLPLSSSIPLFIGGLFAAITRHTMQQRFKQSNEQQREQMQENKQRGLLLACGLVSGAAIMDVLLAIPFALAQNPDVLAIMPASWTYVANIGAGITLIILGIWFYKIVCDN